MSDEDALKAACAAHPGDDTPWLVLADWYDDHGEPGLAAGLRRSMAVREAVRQLNASTATVAAEMMKGFAAMMPTLAEAAARVAEAFRSLPRAAQVAAAMAARAEPAGGPGASGGGGSDAG